MRGLKPPPPSAGLPPDRVFPQAKKPACRLRPFKATKSNRRSPSTLLRAGFRLPFAALGVAQDDNFF
jgi:hypothetical protein